MIYVASMKQASNINRRRTSAVFTVSINSIITIKSYNKGKQMSMGCVRISYLHKLLKQNKSTPPVKTSGFCEPQTDQLFLQAFLYTFLVSSDC